MNKRRVLVVGDTHGSYKGLMQCLEAAGFDPEHDLLIVLGDTQDSWSQAPELMEYYMRLPSGSLIYILGNHDEVFIEWVDNGCRMHPLLNYGGAVTMKNYLNQYADEAQVHAEWLRMQRYYYIDDKNRLFVHAGYNPNLDFKDPGQMIGMQNEYTWNRDFWQGMYEGRNYAKDFTEVFIGHSPTVRYKPFEDKPINRRNVWNLDTAAGFGVKSYGNRGRVTIMDVDSKQYWQSDLCSHLYPTEVGR